MSTVWIDTGRAGATAGMWATRADGLAPVQLRLEADLERLGLGTVRSPVVQHFGSATRSLWAASGYLRMLVEAAVDADLRLDAAGLERLRRLAGHLTDPVAACPAPWLRPTSSSRTGDIGGTFGAELRSPFLVSGATPPVRGRNLVARALEDTADPSQVRVDEFELVRLPGDRFVLVLPGVADLSSLGIGLDPRNRTVRDLDRVAFASARSTRVDDNEYARMVWSALAVAGVPRGAELLIVGHSFGADTALDLAADRRFNGADGYRVTHVVAAGYRSDPQLRHVAAGTEVLVLQNARDAAVIAEAVGQTHVIAAADSVAGVVSSAAGFDAGGAVASGVGAVLHGGAALLGGVAHAVHGAGDLADVGVGLATGDGRRAREGLAAFLTLEPGVSNVSDHQLVSVFDGGGTGLGHHPRNYVDHVRSVDDDRLLAFFASLDAAGYTMTGSAHAIDVSIPRPPTEPIVSYQES